ncbi:MAG: HNH endonuclease [Bacteroidetes bacterium]|nr:MAG: HNH endonuclease [Bacteroidota bacterium]
MDRVRQVVRALARGAAAIDLRIARLCCFIQTQDLRPLGYSSFTAFVRERLCWMPTWQRRLARLLRSDLDLVKQAVNSGVIPLTRALDAPGRVPVHHQRHFIEAVVAGVRFDALRYGPDEAVDVLHGVDAATVRRARRLTRLLLGRRLADRSADQQMRAWHAQGAVPADLLDPTGPDAPPPDPAEARWPDSADDPATVLLGPWTEPVDLDDAVQRAQVAMTTRHKRQAALARMLAEVHRSALYREWGFARFDDWVRHDLDMSVRHAYRLRADARAMDWFDDLAEAVDDKELPPDRAAMLAQLADTAEGVRRWLVIAAHLPANELRRAVADRGKARRRQQRYEALLADAPDLVRQAIAQRQERLEAAALTETDAGLAGWTPDSPRLGPAPDVADPVAGISVALAGPEPVRSGPVIAGAGVLAAARWLLETVELPPVRGIGRVRARADHTCANPECRRRCLRVHVHHVQPRALGGTDDDDNLRCLCPSCHLRLVHGGFMAIEAVGDADVFLYPGRAVVVR